MATGRDDIRKWLVEGQQAGATHVIIACDTYDWEDYPVFVKPGENVVEKHNELDNKNMQKVMEVYSLRKDWEAQLAEHRAFHFD